MIATAKLCAASSVHGIKIHQLMIIRDTVLEQWFKNGQVRVLSLEEYAPLVGSFISYLKPQQCIHRIMADSKPGHGLVEPLWSAEKAHAVAYIRKFMHENGMTQGVRYSGDSR